MNRRQLMQTGTASILIVGCLPACSSRPPASEAWRALSSPYDDPRLTVLASGILAPSPHNRQSWLIALSEDTPDRMTLFADLTRLLPETDPPNRQVLIGLGAFLEAASLSSAEMGRRFDVEIFPQGAPGEGLDTNPIAHLTLGPKGSAEPDPLFAALHDRRTSRVPFDDRPVPDETLDLLGASLRSNVTRWSATNDGLQCADLRDLCQAGWQIEMETPRTHAESVNLTRIGRDEIAANPDGVSLSGPAISVLSGLGVITRDKMRNPETRAFTETHKFYSRLIASARSFGWLVTDDNRRESQLAAGRDWLRLHLAATQAGVAFQPLSQVLQEFPEMSVSYKATHAALSVTTPARIQGLFRLGYAKGPKPSPRWPLQTRLIDMPYE